MKRQFVIHSCQEQGGTSGQVGPHGWSVTKKKERKESTGKSLFLWFLWEGTARISRLRIASLIDVSRFWG